MLHALETLSKGKAIEKNLVTVNGKKYAVYVGKHVSMAHQSQVHGPLAVRHACPEPVEGLTVSGI